MGWKKSLILTPKKVSVLEYYFLNIYSLQKHLNVPQQYKNYLNCLSLCWKSPSVTLQTTEYTPIWTFKRLLSNLSIVSVILFE